MIRLWGADNNLETIVALSRPYGLESDLSMLAVREALRNCMTANQPEVPRPNGELVFTTANGEYQPLLGIFNTESRLDDTPYHLDRGLDATVGKAKLDRVREGVETLRAVDPLAGSFFDLAMFVVFWSPSESATGGTTSQALGVLWVDQPSSWAERDYSEFLVHELSHTLLFLAEWRFGLYSSPEAMTDPSNYAASAIRQTMRPLDKSLHSIIVGAEVLLAREQVLGHTEEYGLHPGSTELRDGVSQSIESVAEVASRSEVLTPFALDLLERARAVTESLSVTSHAAA